MLGKCKKEAKDCSYAHGVEDQRRLPRSDKSKEKSAEKRQLCRNFQKGLCHRTADQCKYIHGNEKKTNKDVKSVERNKRKKKERRNDDSEESIDVEKLLRSINT